MEDELILKIVDVNPPSSESGSKNITKATGEWYTKDKEAKILIEFGNALISLISIQQRTTMRIRLIYRQKHLYLIIRLKGENSDEIYYDKVIWKENLEWNKVQSVDIEPFSQEIYNQMIVEVLNYAQKDYKGLKRIRVFGYQNKEIYNERKKILKQQKKESKNKEKIQKETQNQEKSDQKNLKQKTKIDESSTKKNENWEKYKKPQNQQNKEPIFIDTREKLKNIHKGLSPVKEETEQFEQKAIQTPKQAEVFEKLGSNINERKMTRFNFNQIDKQFLELHQELQQSSGIGKDRQLNYANFETHWLQ